MATAAHEDSRTVTPIGLATGSPAMPAPVTSVDYELREQLSRSLDIETLLSAFFSHLPVPFSGYRYVNDMLGIEYRDGPDSANRVEYRLVLSDEHLGTLSIHRDSAFGFDELSRVEEMLCALVYPMRNATLYQAALKSAFRDPLTGVDNRAALDTCLQREIRLAQRHRTPASLLVLDVDRFKSINDSHGHHMGDRVLQQLVAVFQSVLRTTDVICRYGGDEFVIVLSNTDADGALYVAERIRQRVEGLRIQAGNVRLVLSISIGLTELNADDDNVSVFERADEALLRAKERGRNNVIVA